MSFLLVPQYYSPQLSFIFLSLFKTDKLLNHIVATQ